MRASILASAIGVAASCGQPTSPQATAPDAPRAATTVAAEPEPAGIDAPEHGERVPLPTIEVGVADRPLIGAAARKANREGLEHHRAGRFEQARARFEAAVGASGDHDLARYNLACALARLGRVDESVAQLDIVVVRDPRRFVARIRGDEDLAAVRASPAWAELARRVGAAERGWIAAFETGVPAMFYDYETPMERSGRPQSGGTKNLVVGLYLHAAKKLVPLSHDGEYGFVDIARRRVVRIDSGLCEGVSHSVGREVAITVEGAAPAGGAKLHIDLDREGPKAVGAADIEEILGQCSFPERVVFVGNEHGLWLDVHWQYPDGMKHRALAFDERGLSAGGDAPDGTRFDLIIEGAVAWDPAPAGHSLARERYRPPGATEDVDLGRAHRKPRWQSIVVTPDGALAFVTTIEHWDGPDINATSFGILRHAVTRVQLDDLRVLELAKGGGTARTVIGADGALYLDAGGRVRRWSDPAAAPGDAESAMEGLRLAPPLEPPNCGMCG